MSGLTIRNVTKRYGPVTAVQDVNLDLTQGEMICFLGPSGCGKTTLLRLISGFEAPDAGTIEVRGRRVASATSIVPPERRRIGLVFQDLALFPHLSARQNVAYGIRRDPDQPSLEEVLETLEAARKAFRKI